MSAVSAGGSPGFQCHVHVLEKEKSCAQSPSCLKSLQDGWCVNDPPYFPFRFNHLSILAAFGFSLEKSVCLHPVILSKHDGGGDRKVVAMAAEMMQSRCRMHDIPCLACNYFTSQNVIVAIRVHFSVHNALYLVTQKIQTLKQGLAKP